MPATKDLGDAVSRDAAAAEVSVPISMGTTLGAQWAPAERLQGESMEGLGEAMGRRASE